MASPDPGAALLEFLTEASGRREQRDVSFLLNVADGGAEVIALRDRLYRTIRALVDRARDHGALRPDVTWTDVVLLMCTPNCVVEHLRSPAPDLWRRYLGIIFDGLRPEGAHRLAQPPPTLS
ncbi:SbtR family transcriptional regulator [Amycolatopsis pigmentata]|uniref:Transcriptional regulator SbtR-like C-terminal domain-containing protein n=1 Tax=Amycolatopsis pigmentata TaxID=450801 RepID=A0ABW5FJG3_9PSEU